MIGNGWYKDARGMVTSVNVARWEWGGFLCAVGGGSVEERSLGEVVGHASSPFVKSSAQSSFTGLGGSSWLPRLPSVLLFDFPVMDGDENLLSKRCFRP